MKKIAILGATGSIGRSTIDVIKRNPEEYSLYAATGNKNYSVMAGIIREFSPQVVVMTDRSAYEKLKEIVQTEHRSSEVLFGT